MLTTLFVMRNDMKSNTESCYLCHKDADLQNSHLLAKGFYKIITNVSEPVHVTKTITRTTSQQVKKPLLCKDCEQLFTQNGEEYIIEHCNRENGQFLLKSILDNHEPIINENGFAMFDGNTIDDIDLKKIAYFASSVFWRASVTRWKVGYKDAIKIILGDKYQEQLRQYLLMNANFPKDMALVFFVDSTGKTPIIVSPYSDKPSLQVRTHVFGVQGIHFKLYVGKNIPEVIHNICLYKNAKIFYTDLTKSSVYDAAVRVFADSKQSRKLQKEDAENDVQ